MRIGSLLLLLGAMTACGSPSPEVASEESPPTDRSPEELVGCWDVRLDAWDPPLWRDIEYYQVPAWVELTLDRPPFPAPRSHYSASPSIDAGFEPLPGAWRRVGADSVSLLWTSGFVGVRMELRLQPPDSMTGRAVTFHDNITGPPSPSADVQLVRIRC